MNHPNTRRRTGRVLFALGAALATVLAVSVPAQAGGNVVFRNHVTEKVSHIEQEEHPGEFCDVPYLVRYDASVTVTEMLIRKGGGDLEYFSFHISARETYTNVDTGVSFRHDVVFSGRDQKLTLNDDGTLTVTAMDRFSEKVFDPDGKLVAHEAGIRAFALVIDLNDPQDPEDDEVITETVTKDHGLRGFGDRNLCSDLDDFLG